MTDRRRPGIVGRDAELDAVERWLDRARPALLEIEGEAGIGKTTLWEEAVRQAREAGALILACRPVEIETTVSYGALATLLEPALASVADDLPPPRLRALLGALRLMDVAASRLDETAVALGVLSVLRAAAESRPVLVAVEDVQWLDASSRVALTFALRNLRSADDVVVATTRRLGAGAAGLDLQGSALGASSERIHPSPLSLGALHRMIQNRLGAALSRPRLVGVHAASRGNPLHALELARVIGQRRRSNGPDDVPQSLGEVLRARLASLDPSTRAFLLLIAAAGDPPVHLAARLVVPDGNELDDAVASEVLLVSEGRVRFSHPLLASTVYLDAGELDRSRAHLRLADLADSSEERARHLALGGTGPDEEVASALERAADAACRRGARSTGAALYEQAAALTPEGDPAARDRRLVASGYALFQAGEPEGARSLLETVAGGGTEVRFEALCKLGTLLDETVGGDSSLAAFTAALGADDPALQMQAHRSLAQSLAYVGSLQQALAHVDAAVAVAERDLPAGSLLYALSMQAFVRKLAGHAGWLESLQRGLALEREVGAVELDACPSAIDADTKRLNLDLEGARAVYESLLGAATERGDVPTETWCRFGLASVDLAAGEWGQAGEHARELYDLAEQTGLLRLPALRVSAHLAALQGDEARARELLATVIAEGESMGELHNLRTARHLEGMLELSVGDPHAAAHSLGGARTIADEMAIGDPGLLLFVLDEVEALAALGDGPGARVALAGFESRIDAAARSWAEPLVRRGRGLVSAAEGNLEQAAGELEHAVAGERALPLPLERARTRLLLGRILRRTQRRREAQAMLGGALAVFEELGAVFWASRTREELERIGGRSTSVDLTPTEERIATLVAEGLTNREVGAALFVTPKTVESALTRVYRKLGVRSRTELARRLAETR